MSHVCDYCGSEIDSDDVYCLDGTVMCEDCYDENTRECDCCGTRIWNDDDVGDDDICLCSYCRENHYTVCEDCGRLIHEDNAYYDDGDDYPYCHSCYCENCSDKYIHNYSYKPEPIFYGNGNMFFGVELEIDSGGRCEDNAEILLDIANRNDERMYIKSDGSLNCGMELVTHPMSLDFHINEMPWLDIVSKAVSLGYRSHNTTTCGLHVHVNRSAFGDCRETQEMCISRVLFFIERFWQEMLKFSRRTEAQINHWAARYGIKDTPEQVMDNAKSTGRGRYACINLCNYTTIEFRIFRGTLKYNTLIATLQMVEKICELAVTKTDEELTALSWPEFAESITAPELIRYLKERRLYINEPISETEEI